jgi:hypothetical protein
MSQVRGRPFASGNKSGKGRPRGSRNKVSPKAQELFREFSEPIARKCLALALQGNVKALQLCLERAFPVQKDRRISLGPQPLRTLADVAKASEIVTQQVTSGKIGVEHGTALARMLDMRRQALQTQELESRVSALEQQQPGADPA